MVSPYLQHNGSDGISISPTQCWPSLCPSFKNPSFAVQLLSHVQLFVTPWTAEHQASLSFTIPLSSLKSIQSVILSNHLILCRPLLRLSSIFPSIKVFSSKLALCMSWLIIGATASTIFIPSNKCSGLTFFRIDQFDLLALQGTLKNLLYTTI